MRQVTRKGLMTVAAATGVIAAAGGYAHADSGAQSGASHSPGVLSGNSVQVPVDVPINVCGNTVSVIGALNPATGNACSNRSDRGGRSEGRDGGHSGHHDQGGYGGHGGYGDQGGYGGHDDRGGHGGSRAHGGHGGAHAGGHTEGSPGIGSGNHVQAPVHVPVNFCGNGIDAVGILNPTMGNRCDNDSRPAPDWDYGTPPGGEHQPPEPGNQNPGTPTNPGTSSPTTPEGKPSTPRHVTPAGSSTAHQPAGRATAQLATTGSELPLGLAVPVGAGALLAGAVLYRKARPQA
ncbi:chaplin [Streptomyces sp. NPDC001857]|uniref:chaplin n=1 Tax=Streptomyces sp. NPDC001857 TaxID=3154400 RepID=UPI00332408A5